jgi:DNA polymerase-3 subunit gamma/tau
MQPASPSGKDQPDEGLATGRERLYIPAVSYTVFARKYRPQTFDDVVGQEHITRTLKNAIEQRRLAHAYIFVGPRGTGKTSTARILAKSLNCQSFDAPTTKPCGTCDSCKEITGGNSLDVLEFDAASNTQVDKVRELIIDNVKYAPTRGRYKVYIVDEVHMLSPSSFNALLKTLEEPPEHVKFAFATTDVQKVPTTILSRCQRFDLKRIPSQLIAGHLQHIAKQEKIKLSQQAADTIAHGAEGGMRDAESMLDQLVAFCGCEIEEADVLSIFGLTAHETVSGLCEHIISGETPAALAMLHEQSEAGRDLARLMSDLIAHLRNLLVAQVDPGSLTGEQGAEAVRELTEQAGRVRGDKLLELIEQFAGAEARMRWSPNRKMHFEIAVIRAIQTLGQATLSEVIETLSAMRGGAAPPVVKAPEPRPKPAVAPRPVAKAPAPVAVEKPAVVVEKPAAVVVEQAPPWDEEIDAGSSRRHAEPEAAPVMAARAPEPEWDEPEAAAPAATVAESDLAARWPEVVAEVRQRRPLIVGWIDAGTLVSFEKGIALLAFPPSQRLAAEALTQPTHRNLLQEILTAIAGEPVAFKTTVRDGVAEKAPVVRPEKPPADPMAEFKDDPLIRRALEIFGAKIQPA